MLINPAEASYPRPNHVYVIPPNRSLEMKDGHVAQGTRWGIHSPGSERSREVYSDDDHWYMMRILPYRRIDDRIEGVAEC